MAKTSNSKINIMPSKILNTTPKIIGLLLFILAALLPIQNLIVVFGVNVLGLPNWLALWKEGFVIVLIVCILIDLLQNIVLKNLRCKWFLGLFGLLNLLVLVSSLLINRVALNQFILGYRFELLWLWLWLIGFVWVQNTISFKNPVADGLSLHQQVLQFYKQQLVKGIFLGFGLCLVLSLGQVFIGKDFVQFFGYTDSSAKLVTGKINSPICHSIDFGVEPCRLAAPFSSPNHLAGYLVFILGFMLLYTVKRGELQSIQKNITNFNFQKLSFTELFHNLISALTNYYFLPIAIIISILIFLTYSRFALIILILYWVFVFIYLFKQKFSSLLVALILVFTLAISLLVTSVEPSWATRILPSFLAKPSSSLEHYRLTQVSLDILKSEPSILISGLGQGASGSSTTYFQPDQNLIYNRFKDLSYNWFIKPERISVPENWYLQLVLNGGLVYLALYLFILIYPILSLLKNKKVEVVKLPLDKGLAAQADWGFKSGYLQNPPNQTFNFTQGDNSLESKNKTYQNLFVFLAFFGIMLGNIFLHLWENQTIAIYWSLIYLWWSLESKTQNE